MKGVPKSAAIQVGETEISDVRNQPSGDFLPIENRHFRLLPRPEMGFVDRDRGVQPAAGTGGVRRDLVCGNSERSTRSMVAIRRKTVRIGFL